MATIRTITDPQEKTLAILDDLRTGNTRTRNEIRRLRQVLREGEKEESRLERELARLASELAQRKQE